MYPQVRSKISFYDTNEPDIYYVYDPELDKHYKMGKREVNWLKMCDGQNSIEQIVEKIGEDCSLDIFQAFIEAIKKLNLLEGEQSRLLKKKFNLFQIKWNITNPDQWMTRHIHLVKFIMLLFKLMCIPIIVLGGYYGWKSANEIMYVVLSFQFEWTFIPMYIISFFLIMVLHELSHALMAKSYNAPVTAIGLMFFYFQPAAYADLSGIWLLPKLRHRILSLLAGIISQIMCSAILITTYYFFGDFSSRFWQYVIVIAIGNIFVALVNLIPFVKLDGYFILCMMLNISALREKSMNYISTIFDKRKRETVGKEIAYVYAGFGVISAIYTPVMLLSGILFIRRLIEPFVNENVLNVIVIGLTLLVIIWPIRGFISKISQIK